MINLLSSNEKSKHVRQMKKVSRERKKNKNPHKTLEVKYNKTTK